MNQPREIGPLTFPLPDDHSQGIQGQVRVQTRGSLPADDPPRAHVSHESHINLPGEGAYIEGAPPACGGMSATHSSFGLNALKRLFDKFGRGTALAARCAWYAGTWRGGRRADPGHP